METYNIALPFGKGIDVNSTMNTKFLSRRNAGAQLSRQVGSAGLPRPSDPGYN